jgi:small RNA 2'-O-methyltransferase
MTTWWHEARLLGVLAVLREAGARRVLDLGCGAGDLVLRLLAEPGIAAVTGLDPDREALARLRARLPAGESRLRLIEGSALALPELPAHDAAVLVEVIEHLDPGALSKLERAVFHRLAPPLVVLTTPNAEFNRLLGVPTHRFRHPDHRFEWGRAKFADWARGVAARAGYAVTLHDLAGAHPDLGGASQMAVFTRAPAPDAPG